nr:hypothetical protein [Hallella colorans]
MFLGLAFLMIRSASSSSPTDILLVGFRVFCFGTLLADNILYMVCSDLTPVCAIICFILCFRPR